MNLRRSCAVLLLGATAAFGSRLSFQEHAAVQESLRRVPQKMRMEWLHERGIKMPAYEASTMLSDSGLRLVGKWGRGPAVEVTGKDTIAVLTLGSEVALLNFANPDSPVVLSEIQFPSLTAQSCLVDSLLHTSSNVDLEVWNVSDPTQPVKRGQLLGAVGDFWMRDTFLFYIRRDTFHVLSIANPANLYELGNCNASGAATTGSGNTVVVLQSGGLKFVDVSDPASPHEVGSYPCGYALSATARGNLVCASYEDSYPYPVRFITIDISTPSSPRLLAKLNDLGGYDIFLDGPLAFVSGGDPGTIDPLPFQILSIADSAHPAFIDSCRTTVRYPWGVWESYGLNRALVADEFQGLAVVDISNLNNPVLDTCVLAAGYAADIHVDGRYCYVASGISLRVLDVTDPGKPVCVSGLDTMYAGSECDAVTARDSFAYVCWAPNPTFRSVDVTDPLRPQFVAGCSLGGFPQAVVLRDSFVYVAQNYGFLVINVARPRAPVVVGTCNLPGLSYEMDAKDTLIYVANGVSGLQIVNVAQPDSPTVVGSIAFSNPAIGVAVEDSFAYVGANSLRVVNVARPGSPFVVDTVPLPIYGGKIAIADTVLYVGTCLGYAGDLRSFSIANPTSPRQTGFYATHIAVDRVVYAAPYVYAACDEAGVAVLETTAAGVQEPSPRVNQSAESVPTIIRDAAWKGLTGGADVFDAMGRRVTQAKPGVYFVVEEPQVSSHKHQAMRKVVLVE